MSNTEFGLIVIGSELLTGKRQDSHLSHVIEVLTAHGLDLGFCHYLGDDPDRLSRVLGLNPNHARLNDINPHLVNFYRCMQRGMTIRIAMHNDSTLYYQHRQTFNRLAQGAHRNSQKTAGLFYYLNRAGFNGLCRFNKNGGFNLPFGRYTTINYQRNFNNYRPTLERWQFTNMDFAELALRHSDLVYADPPYDVPFRQYAQDGFNWSDQVRLAQWLTTHSGPVVLSNQATVRIRKLYKGLGFTLKILAAPRMISCNGNRTPALEVLAMRNIRVD